MLNNKFRARQFAPKPMDYMKHKIERLRENLITTEQQSASNERYSMTDDFLEKSHSQFTSSDEVDDYADDEGSSEAGASDLLSIPDSPLLPLHKNDISTWETIALSKTYRLFKQPITILLLTTAIFIPSSSALAILDRFNMYQATYKFPFPLTHLFCQLVFCEVALLFWALLSHTLSKYMPAWKGTVGLTENITWDFSVLKSLAPVSLSYLLAGSAFISCLEYVPMDFAVLMLSPMMLCQLALSKYFTPENTQSAYIAIACIALMVGHALASLSTPLPGMPGYNVQGMIASAITCIAQPVHNCLVKKHLPRLDYQTIQLLHYTLVSAILMTVPLLIISGEVFEISVNCFFLDEAGFWLMMLLLCFISVLATTSQFLLLTFTSPLTLVVLLFSKTALIQVPISGLLNKSHMNWLNWVGILICLASTACYLYLINLHRPNFGLRWQN